MTEHRTTLRLLALAASSSLLLACSTTHQNVDLEPSIPVGTSNAVDIAEGYVTWSANTADRAAELTDTELRTRRDLAGALLSEGEVVAARRHLNILVAARPGWWSTQLHYATAVYLGSADLDGALAALDRCIAIEPNAQCHQLRAAVLVDLGERELGLMAYKSVVDLVDYDDELAERMARIYRRLEFYGDALAHIEIALEIEQDVSRHLLAGQLLENLGRIDEAEDHFWWLTAYHTNHESGLRYALQFYTRQGWTEHAVAVQAELDAMPPQREVRQLRDL